MKISRFILFLFSSSILLTACSSNDDNELVPQEETGESIPIVSGVTTTYVGVPVDQNLGINKQIMLTTIQDNKKQISISESFYKGESQGTQTLEEFFTIPRGC